MGGWPHLVRTQDLLIGKFKEAQSVRMQLITGKISKHQFDDLTWCKYVVIISGENCIIFFAKSLSIWRATTDSRLKTAPNAWLIDANRLFLFTHYGQNQWFLTRFLITHAFFTADFSNQKTVMSLKLLGNCEAFSHESESKAYYLDDEEFLLRTCIHLMKPPHLLDPPPAPKKHGISRQRGDRCFFLKAAQQEWIVFFCFENNKKVCMLSANWWCHEIPWIAAQEPLSPIRHEDKRSERQGRFGCFARGDGHGYFSLAVFAEVG